MSSVLGYHSRKYAYHDPDQNVWQAVSEHAPPITADHKLDPAWRDRRFLVLWFAQVAALVAAQVYQAANQWLILDLTGSLTLLGTVPLVQGVLTIICSPAGGALGDRLARRDLLVFTRAGAALAVLGVGVAGLMGQLAVWQVLVAVALVAAFAAVAEPIAQALAYELAGVQRAMSAIAMISTASSVVLMAGPAVAGALIALTGVLGNYWVTAALFALAVPLLVTLPVGHSSGRVHRNWLSDLPEGFAAIRDDSTLRWLLLICLSNLFSAGVLTLRPVYARDVLEVGGAGFGLMGTAFGIGAILSSGVLLSLGRVRRIGMLFLGCLVAWDIMTVVYAFSRWFPLTLACEFVGGLAGPIYTTAMMTIIQLNAPDASRARVTGLFVASQQVFFVGQFLIGAAADTVGVTAALAGAGLTRLALVLLFVWLAVPVRRARG